MLLAAFLFAGLCIWLGRWQFSRHEQRVAMAERIEAHYSAPARPVGEVLSAAPLAREADWTTVSMRGVWRPTAYVVRNRANNGEPGSDILGVLDVPGVGAVLVDVGFAPAGGDARTLPALPSFPLGEVEVTGWARVPEESRGRELPAGQLATITPSDAAPQTGPLLGGYVRLREPLAGLTALEEPSTGLGPHLAYAIQWWLTTVAGFAFVWFGIRRELQDEAAALGTDPAVTERSRRARQPSLEDEEDAELEAALSPQQVPPGPP